MAEMEKKSIILNDTQGSHSLLTHATLEAVTVLMLTVVFADG